MPTELRRIIFAEAEVIEAITLHSKASSEKLPPGVIRSCVVGEDEGVSVHLEIQDETNNKTYRVTLKSEMLAAVMLRYCFQLRVPIPRGAKKTLEIFRGRLALYITYGSAI